PAEVRVHPREQSLGIDDRYLDEEDIGQERPDFPPPVFPAAADEHLRLLVAVDLDDSRLVQLRHEAREVFDGNGLRTVFPLERLFHLLQSQLAIELLEQEVLLELEAKILECEWIFDDIVRHSLVKLRLDDEIRPEPDFEVFGRLSERQRR